MGEEELRIRRKGRKEASQQTGTVLIECTYMVYMCIAGHTYLYRPCTFFRGRSRRLVFSWRVGGGVGWEEWSGSEVGMGTLEGTLGVGVCMYIHTRYKFQLGR